jgi:hypothetical protein
VRVEGVGEREKGWWVMMMMICLMLFCSSFPHHLFSSHHFLHFSSPLPFYSGSAFLDTHLDRRERTERAGRLSLLEHGCLLFVAHLCFGCR